MKANGSKVGVDSARNDVKEAMPLQQCLLQSSVMVSLELVYQSGRYLSGAVFCGAGSA